MSYPIDLEEVSHAVLIAELDRRQHLYDAGKCPYCSQPVTTHACKFKDRIKNLYNPKLPHEKV